MGRRFRVLVADDSEDAADTLAMLLELSGYDVRVAYDGEAALELAEHWPPDAAILDLKMPGRDGYDVAKTLRAQLPRQLVLVAHSGKLAIRQRDLTATSLFDLCLSKGMEFTELLKQFEDLLKSGAKDRPKSGPNGGPDGGPNGGPKGGSRGGPASPPRGHSGH